MSSDKLAVELRVFAEVPVQRGRERGFRRFAREGDELPALDTIENLFGR
jgi:hypothetical protein